jgi:hydrogenase expression/formation protein HypD
MDLSRDFKRPDCARQLSLRIHAAIGSRRFKIMEVCGGQTHTIYKYRLQELLPEELRLVSGPGCPVCVTPISFIDKAVRLALEHGVALFTFGDLLRVPGTSQSLEQVRAAGADVRIVYAPQQALAYAGQNPGSEVVFLGIGFETTLPSIGLLVKEAARAGLKNFSILLSAKGVPPVLAALLSSPQKDVQGFITPGHVTAVIGTEPYDGLCERFRVPMVVGGFEPLDLLLAIYRLAQLLAAESHANLNAYTRVVHPQGNPKAQAVIADVFEQADDEFRGLGVVPAGGFRIRPAYGLFDAEQRFDLTVQSSEPQGCICGQILAGIKSPADCGLFRGACTPEAPIGSCMVSSEGTCNAAYLYGEQGHGQ